VPLWLTGNQLDGALEAIADFSDLKSPYLAGHSRGVAELARDAADQFGLNAADSTNVYRAGLLHDLGRVAVSAGVWGKPGQLNDSEWERVRLHPYYTERILSRVPALAPLGTIGCKHHERLDGSGYPRGVRIADLPMSARLIAAADVYRAMLEPRPHRAAQPAAGAANVIREESKAGRLDAAAVDAVLAAAGHRVRRRRPRRPAGLSEREVDVLRLIARGRSDRDAAAILHLSSRTVHHHVQHIYDKLGVATRAAATLFAMQHGLLEPADAPER
jgi:HD-GYP domain-containing protein (c-di-GMP phosphodiesterase class II)